MMALFVLFLVPLLSSPMVAGLGFVLCAYSTQFCLSGTSLTLWGSLDCLSALLLAMTFFLLPCTLFSVGGSRSLLLVYTSLVFVFTLLVMTQNLLLFYVCFEFTLVPMVLMLMAWGKQPERLTASVYMLFYTIVSSLPFLVIVILYGGLSFWGAPLVEPLVSGVGLLVLLPFCVKLPVFFVHIWLPKAHVEAPVFGSMVLAATLLKIGCYGVWRLAPLLSPSVSLFAMALSVAGAAICSWVTFYQTDIKAVIAYSSVVHMGLLMFSVLTLRAELMQAALMMMVSHGFCSSGLFYLATASYERVSTRSLPVMQGLVSMLPALALAWCLLILANLSAPPSLSLLSEVLSVCGVLSLEPALVGWVALMFVFVLVYSLSLFWNTYHGGTGHFLSCLPETMKECLMGFSQCVWFVLWVLGFWLFES